MRTDQDQGGQTGNRSVFVSKRRGKIVRGEEEGMWVGRRSGLEKAVTLECSKEERFHRF